MKDIVISVVIITHNKVNYLRAILKNLENQTYTSSIEYIVVNDGSSDNTKDFLDNYNGRLNLQFNTIENSGAAVARNTGIRMSKGKYILFLDDDIILEISYIEKLLSSISIYPNKVHSGKIELIPLDVVPSIIEELDNTGKINHDYLLKHSYVDTIYKTLQIAYSKPLSKNLCCWWGIVSGGNICFPRHIIEDSGYFDETFKEWGPEDIDFCYRAFKKNYTHKYNENCHLYHLDHPRKITALKNLMIKNAFTLYTKYNKPKEILAYLNFFNGMVSLNAFNDICSEIMNEENNVNLEEYFINLNYYIEKNQIINWRKNDTD
jgi:glycosyltransferase involved in cell wall biosynthesis